MREEREKPVDVRFVNKKHVRRSLRRKIRKLTSGLRREEQKVSAEIMTSRCSTDGGYSSQRWATWRGHTTVVYISRELWVTHSSFCGVVECSCMSVAISFILARVDNFFLQSLWLHTGCFVNIDMTWHLLPHAVNCVRFCIGAVCDFLFVYDISERICAKFRGKTYLVSRSDELEGQGTFRRHACGLCLENIFALVSSIIHCMP